jgi:hypothetical protein
MKIGFEREVDMKIVEFNDWLENEVTIEQLADLTGGLTNRELAELMYEAITNPKNPVYNRARDEAEELFYHLVAAESVQVVDWDDDDGYADYMYDKMKDDMLTGDW